MIKFFISYHHGAGFGRLQHTAAEARDIVRHAASAGIKAKTLPVRELTGDDFADFDQRIILADLGYFSIDLPEHRTKRAEQTARKWEIASAYLALGLDQKREYDRIAGAIPNSEGTWPRSTARYARDVESLDNAVLAHAEDRSGFVPIRWIDKDEAELLYGDPEVEARNEAAVDHVIRVLEDALKVPTNEEMRKDIDNVGAGFRFDTRRYRGKDMPTYDGKLSNWVIQAREHHPGLDGIDGFPEDKAADLDQQEKMSQLIEAYGEPRAEELVVQTFGTIDEAYDYAVSEWIIKEGDTA